MTQVRLPGREMCIFKKWRVLSPAEAVEMSLPLVYSILFVNATGVLSPCSLDYELFE